MNGSFLASHSIDGEVDNNNFRLHTHVHYEIYMFIDGDAEHIVEGGVYALNPMDMILLRPGEMHRVFHKSNCRYERFVLGVEDAFFKEMNCEEYKKVFWSHEPGEKNKLDGEIVLESGIYDCVTRIKKYSSNCTDMNVPAVRAAVVELLHILNNTDDYTSENNEHTIIKDIISYINNHYKRELSLSELSDEFFVSKYHLCRIFKAATGYTVNGYVSHKRIMNVKLMCDSGMNIGYACQESGFGDYSSFYKAYVKETGHSPREGLKNKLIDKAKIT
ncbi:MAG: AraC family transcriptional regulator [Bacillota bacterium]|nr:AraC family transcriptional regulator [Bacillota bacterium]